MGLGRAGGSGRPAHQGERLGQEPAIILHPTVAEQPAWAPPLRLTAVRVMFPLEVLIQNNLLSVFLQLIKITFSFLLLMVEQK